MNGVDLSSEILFYKSIINNISVVVDCGCRSDNIFYNLSPNLEIHLFEPMKTPDILAMAESVKNIPNIYFNNYGLSSKEEWKDFYIEYQSLSTAWHKQLDRPKTSEKILFRRLYDYINETNIKVDLLKIDAEAWDFEVIKGAGDKIWDIKYVQFEYGWTTYGESDTVQDIFNYFPGYNFYNIGGSPLNCVITKENLSYPRFI